MFDRFWREQKPITLEQVGAELGLSEEKIQEIKARALSKLRNAGVTMETGIPVSFDERGAVRIGVRVVAILALIGGILAATFAAQRDPLPGIILAGAGAVVLAINEVLAAVQRAARRAVVVTEDGFRWIGKASGEDIADRQITAVRLKRKPKFSNGIPQGHVRRFEVWTAADAPPLCMVNRLRAGENDPLGNLIARIIEDLKQRTAAGLAEGAALEGEGWLLGEMQLIVVRGRREEAIPFGQIDFVGAYDGKFCVWRQGEVEAAVKIGRDSKNAPVLIALLGEWVAHRNETAVSPDKAAAKTGLGRLLFARRSNVFRIFGGVFAAIAGFVGIALASQQNSRGIGLVFLLAAFVTGTVAWIFGRVVLGCYELGIAQRWGRKERRMAYTEIVTLTCSATRMFVHGAYAGTQCSMKFQSPTQTINYWTRYQNSDEDLDGLRDHVARVLAGQILAELRAGRPATWLSDVAFLPEGLQIRRAKILGLGSRPPEVLPYGEIRGVNLENGKFSLFNQAQSRAVLAKPASTPNFFPGYLALRTLLAGGGKK